VVQSVNPIDRTTRVKWYPPSPLPGDSTISLVSSLELDPVCRIECNNLSVVYSINLYLSIGKQHGSFEPEAHEAFGVQRGDIVFIHLPSRPNGSEIPK
jgi:hypothetical protein